MNLKDNFKNHLSENINCHLNLINIHKDLEAVIKSIYNSLKKGGKILFCGNGGSAADAQHLAAEFLVRLRPKINRSPIPALTLAQDTSTITACGNDYSFDEIFVRPFEAICDSKDILFAISTSGNSKNIYNVLKVAKKKKIKSIGLLGGDGGKCIKLCDHTLLMPTSVTARVQECHIFIGHFILEQVEDLLIKNKLKY